MDPDVAKREGGATFQEFPSSLDRALRVAIRNQMQALLLFRALDVDGDGVISKEDCGSALSASGGDDTAHGLNTARSRGGAPTARSDATAGGAVSPGSRARVMQQDVVLADKYLAAVCDALDRQRVTVRGMFSSVVRQSGRQGAGPLASNAYVTEDEFKAFVRGWVPKPMGNKLVDDSNGIADCVLGQVDVNVDGAIGWDEFQSAFVACSGRRLLRLRLEAERLQESRLPSLLPRYKSTVAAIGRCQVGFALLCFRVAGRSSHPFPPVSAPLLNYCRPPRAAFFVRTARSCLRPPSRRTHPPRRKCCSATLQRWATCG